MQWLLIACTYEVTFPGLSSSLLKPIWKYILLDWFFPREWDWPVSSGELWFVISIIFSSQMTGDFKAAQVGDMVLEAMGNDPG